MEVVVVVEFDATDDAEEWARTVWAVVPLAPGPQPPSLATGGIMGDEPPLVLPPPAPLLLSVVALLPARVLPAGG
jgi:hypothetical protein